MKGVRGISSAEALRSPDVMGMNWTDFVKLLPLTAKVNDAGHLEIGGLDTIELAREHGTPLFVCDLDDVRDRLARYGEAFGISNVFYASKAFLTRPFARVVAECGVGMDCVAGGEVYVALRGGFPAERIGVHGNNKSAREIAEALEAGVGRIIVDSVAELVLLRRVAEEIDARATVLLRIAPGVEVGAHAYLDTGAEDSKFGISGSDAAAAIAMAASDDRIELVGLHSHIGSHGFELEPFAEAGRKMMDALAEARRETGLELPELCLGGGLGIAYTTEDEPASIEDLGKLINDTVATEAERLGTPMPRVQIEPGRSAVGPSMVTLYEAGVVKDTASGRRYVAVDGGMSDNIRVPLYQARYTWLSASRPRAPHERACTIAGKLCESGDLLGEAVLPDVEMGEIVCCAATGAYNYAMASNYNKQPLPAVVGVSKGEVTVLAPRQTYEDLV